MTAQGQEAAALALHRFGFGPVGDSISAIANDPRGALLADLERPGGGQIAAVLPSSADAARQVADFRAEQQAQQKLAQRAKQEADAKSAAMADGPSGMANAPAKMSDAASMA
ncbi:MAG: DUF1800 domain-containing protein, partial [Xanthobacteraceae bacterium]